MAWYLTVTRSWRTGKRHNLGGKLETVGGEGIMYHPKVFLLFLALLPQFTDPKGSWSVAMQMSALGLLHLITCTLVYLLVGYGSKAILATRPQAARLVSRASGGMMVVIAVVLLFEQIG